MAFKPNYNQQRAERNRAAQAKKDAKQQERDAAVARRKAAQFAPDSDADQTAAPTPDADAPSAGTPTGS
ncbi:MAG: hypothetical protein HIU82_21905 [Proteobacteria bacterium]|nr:hypothetical protein [Pseudomonadota bacterium]